MSGLAISQLLDQAADLIEPTGAWVQKELGYDANGQRIPTAETIGEAVCFCTAGAIWRASKVVYQESDEIVWKAFRHLGDTVGFRDGVGPWNDAPERTQTEVIAALREAADAAREQEK